MIRFNNDYNHGAFASLLKELGATNSTSYAGYGEDEWCDRAETIIEKLVDNDDALIKFIPGATQANYVVIAAALSSVQSVIAVDTGHINCHEAASIENTGHKILNFRIQMAGLPRSRSPLAPRHITIRTSRSI